MPYDIMNSLFFYQTSIGKIAIADNGMAITNIIFANQSFSFDVNIRETLLIERTAQQIVEYLNGERLVFDLPIAPNGTEFQLSVWNALLKIPYGETRSYGLIAKQIGNPKGSRAVGMANNRNPIPILIPCHRVIGMDGKLVGFGGGLDVKKLLLELERNTKDRSGELF